MGTSGRNERLVGQTMWGSQFWLQPPFRRLCTDFSLWSTDFLVCGQAGKPDGRQNCLPHNLFRTRIPEAVQALGLKLEPRGFPEINFENYAAGAPLHK